MILCEAPDFYAQVARRKFYQDTVEPELKTRAVLTCACVSGMRGHARLGVWSFWVGEERFEASKGRKHKAEHLQNVST